jgi:ribulose-phosphate 3-epimerase
VDGGINLDTAKKCFNAGVDVLVSGNYIFASENPAKILQDLKSIN